MQYLAKYLVIPLLAAIAAPLSQAALETTREQTWTLRALITELEDTHFVDKRYNDAMSRAHLETYLERLDPSRLYFTQSDVNDFAKFETTLDDLGRQGELYPAVEIYERYREIAAARLRTVIDDMAVLHSASISIAMNILSGTLQNGAGQKHLMGSLNAGVSV